MSTSAESSMLCVAFVESFAWGVLFALFFGLLCIYVIPVHIIPNTGCPWGASHRRENLLSERSYRMFAHSTKRFGIEFNYLFRLLSTCTCEGE